MPESMLSETDIPRLVLVVSNSGMYRGVGVIGIQELVVGTLVVAMVGLALPWDELVCLEVKGVGVALFLLPGTF